MPSNETSRRSGIRSTGDRTWRADRQGPEQAQRRGADEQTLGEQRQRVLDEGAAESTALSASPSAAQNPDQASEGDPADGAVRPGRTSPASKTMTASAKTAAFEHERHPGKTVISRPHSLTTRFSSGTVAVSIGFKARPGATPNSTSTHTRSQAPPIQCPARPADAGSAGRTCGPRRSLRRRGARRSRSGTRRSRLGTATTSNSTSRRRGT